SMDNNNNNNTVNNSKSINSSGYLGKSIANNSMTFLSATRNNPKLTFKQLLPMISTLFMAIVVTTMVILTRNYSANNLPSITAPYVIVEDDQLLEVAFSSRNWLLSVNPTITKLDFTVMVLNPVGSWSVASYNGDVLANASSCVYLPFLAAAVNWCLGGNQEPQCLQPATGPMMNDFSSIYAGIIVDRISGAPNTNIEETNSTAFTTWMHKRRYVENFLEENGLLGNQSIFNKIYPSNSGPVAAYTEALALEIVGPNMMNPLDSATLMLYMIQGGITPDGQSYMTDLLSRQTFSEYTSFGFGLPPGTVLHSIIGTSDTDVNEIAHIILPNGRQLIMSAFTDGYENFGTPPYQSSILGMFASRLIHGMNLTKGDPTMIIMDSSQTVVVPEGGWKTAQSKQAYNNTYLYIDGGGVVPFVVMWNFPINTTGLYEVCVWFPAATNQTTTAIYTVTTGDESYLTYQFIIDQQHYGARWILLDSFYFVAGTTPVIHISSLGTPKGQVIVADAVKLTMWPTTDGIPGLAENYVSENYNY
ncbi:hypothetical protein SAMD00019534_027370, partial [Acytostelium subglobosum LB1]|uniref:hypothetical protein n=1 Tax=Acytostelium subglobosum LB1 TaxID=1410327 RepID=UPI000644BFA8